MSRYFTHADAEKVILTYDVHAVKLVATAESLLKSILASYAILRPV